MTRAADDTAGRGRATTPPGALLRRVVPLVWLVVVWMLLWGTFSWANLLSGLVVGGLVLAFFPLPRIAGPGRPRLWPALRFLRRFAVDLVRSSLQVTWLSIRPGPPVRSAVVAVRLADPSEFLLAMVVGVLSLVPGSVVIDADPATSTLWAHVLGADDDAALDAFRAQVRQVEADLAEAVGRTPGVLSS